MMHVLDLHCELMNLLVLVVYLVLERGMVLSLSVIMLGRHRLLHCHDCVGVTLVAGVIWCTVASSSSAVLLLT